jgi:hypothetical protein
VGEKRIEPINIARRLWIETHPLMVSASLPAGDRAALETILPINETEATAAPQQMPQVEITKRTQLPGTST